MKRFTLSPEAARDIRDIWAYIGEGSIPAAGRVRVALLDACRKLADHPAMGHTRTDLTEQPVRFWPVGSYLIIYNPTRRPIEIVRVVHAARDVPDLL